MTITARFESVCPRCNNRISVGSRVNWERGSKATHVTCPPAVAAPVRAAVAAQRRLTPEDAGVYVGTQNADNIYRVRLSQKGNAYAETWRVITANRATDPGAVVHGEWVYEDAQGNRYSARVAAALDSGKLRKMSADEARAFATRYRQCVRCGRHLSDADSVDAGMGDTCAKYFGIDRKANARAARAVRAEAAAAATATIQAAGGTGRRPRSYEELFGDEDPGNVAEAKLAAAEAPAAEPPARPAFVNRRRHPARDRGDGVMSMTYRQLANASLFEDDGYAF